MAESRQGAVAYRAVLLAGGLLVLGLLFEQLVTLLLAVLITVIVAIALSAFADRLERRLKIPRPIGALLGIVLGLSVLAGVMALIIPPFIDQTNQFVDDVPGIVDDLRDQVADLTGAEPGEISDRVQEFADKQAEDPEKLIGPITSIGFSAAGVLGALLLVLITAYYMAINPQPLLAGVRSLVPPGRRDDADRVMSRLRNSWIGWMQGVVVDMLVSGILLYIGLTIIGLDFAIFFAVLTALLSVIPYFGAIISGAAPGAVRAHRFSGQGAAGDRGLHAGAAVRGQRDHPPGHGPHREAAPGRDRRRRGGGRSPVRVRRPDRGRADPVAAGDPGRGAVGEADGGSRPHTGNANDHESLNTAIAIDATTKITIRTCK